MNTYVLLALIMIPIIGGMCWLVIYLHNQGASFYKMANVLENKVRTEDNIKVQYDELMELNKKAFHRTLSGRVREIAKMMEIKYNIEILKR